MLRVETHFLRKNMPSFTLALSPLLEEPEPSSSRDSLISRSSGQASSSSRHRDESWLEYPVALLHDDGLDDEHGVYCESDYETEVDDCDDGDRYSLESVTVYDELEAPVSSRFMFLRRFVWKLMHRCPECGEKLGPLESYQNRHTESPKKRWISSIFNSSSSEIGLWRK
ncbi:hypothetical protein DFP72DRAFT_840811 [Ephemerocybe angulata]|uniref:Uncharacterized protein n=1 Tax=Ephemerocybe angulata TaxID=980116 RepID=A0A8H6IH13_9AGAR|nr:hypothetical protein DFP72DRAFT_840811 [Tulosesus angulatus]